MKTFLWYIEFYFWTIILKIVEFYWWLVVRITKLRLWWWFVIERHTSEDFEKSLIAMGATIIEQDEKHTVYKYKEGLFTITSINGKDYSLERRKKC